VFGIQTGIAVMFLVRTRKEKGKAAWNPFQKFSDSCKQEALNLHAMRLRERSNEILANNKFEKLLRI
jgi:gamma-glutamyl phosphate reductase